MADSRRRSEARNMLLAASYVTTTIFWVIKVTKILLILEILVRSEKAENEKMKKNADQVLILEN